MAAPGAGPTRLPSEAEIARLFAVSTRTIRDALQILETKGLVQRRHGECAVVVRNDVAGYLGSLALTAKQLLSTGPGYFRELMDVRRMIEPDVVNQLCAPAGAVNAEVEQALAGMPTSTSASGTRTRPEPAPPWPRISRAEGPFSPVRVDGCHRNSTTRAVRARPGPGTLVLLEQAGNVRN